jgi:shikimate kinase
MNTLLIGFKSAGKTSVGEYLATQTQQLFVDTDRLMEQHYYAITQQTRSVREIYQENGHDYFRHLEKSTVTGLAVNNHIIATGGGCILDPDNIYCLKKLGIIIYLSASFDTLLKRLTNQPVPAFLNHDGNVEQNLYTLYQQRQPLYEAAADHTIVTEHKSIAIIADEISTLIKESAYGQ